MNMKRQYTDRDLQRSHRRSHLRGRRCRGITMLELVIAGSMLAVVMTSLSSVMRTVRQSSEAVDGDYAKLHQAHSVARHIVRSVREATSVQSITGGSAIELNMNDGSTISYTWRAADSGLVNVVSMLDSSIGAERPLGYSIESLSFEGLEADGVTPAASIEDTRLLTVSVEVLLPRGNNARQIVSSKVWIRAW